MNKERCPASDDLNARCICDDRAIFARSLNIKWRGAKIWVYKYTPLIAVVAVVILVLAVVFGAVAALGGLILNMILHTDHDTQTFFSGALSTLALCLLFRRNDNDRLNKLEENLTMFREEFNRWKDGE